MKHAAGFTLVELILIIVMLGILVVAVTTRGGGRTLERSGQVEQLASDLRYVQSLSMTQGQRYCLFFTAANYQIRNTNCATAVAHPATASTTPIVLSSVSLSWTNLPNNYVSFSGIGAPYTDATTLLSPADAVITLSGNGDTGRVYISPQTGRVSVTVP